MCLLIIFVSFGEMSIQVLCSLLKIIGCFSFKNPLQYSWASLGGSAGKESACNVGDLGLISGLGRSLGEGKGYPLQYSRRIPWCHKESDMTEALFTFLLKNFIYGCAESLLLCGLFSGYGE